MPEHRPNPDQLLSSLKVTQPSAQRGRLKIYFGASPGVGKTYSMLQDGQALRQSGVDVVAGIIETHGRSETAALLGGLELLPSKEIPYKGITLLEFDLDAALARRPRLILVDELAHTNAPGSRHAKRWQDVEELLAAGIDVFTAVNVQHLESLNDVVAQITGVIVRETVPDSVVERADEIELVDITTDELLNRLQQGKVYIPEQAERAMQSFFSKANLTALREMALRHTAHKVDVEMQAHRALTSQDRPWAASERLLVCIGPSPHSGNLVRATHRVARGLHADWEAVYVETPAAQELPEELKQRVIGTMLLAEQLGGRSITLSGPTVADTLVEYARQRNATKILVGKPSHSTWRDRIRGSLVEAVIRRSGEIDVYVLRAAGEVEPKPESIARPRGPIEWQGYLVAGLAVGALTLAAQLVRDLFSAPNLIMLYLLIVALIALRYRRGPAILASVLAVATFDFFFIEPFGTFGVTDVQYLLTFIVMLGVGLVIGSLTARLKQTAIDAVTRERRTASMYRFSSELALAGEVQDIARLTERQVSDLLRAKAVVMLAPAAGGSLVLNPEQAAIFTKPTAELAVAQWAFDNRKPAGRWSATLPGAEAHYTPLITARGRYGVLAVKIIEDAATAQLGSLDDLHQLQTVANLAALALEREVQVDARIEAQSQVESEQLRNSLLSSISHDLRTPLAGIAGAATTLLTFTPDQLVQDATPLLNTVRDESNRLALLVSNILDMTRLEAGEVRLTLEWLPLEEPIGAALTALESRLADRRIEVALPLDTPLIKADAVLMERLFANLLDNALKYTPAGSPIEIAAQAAHGYIEVTVADHGPGLPTDAGDLFRKFGANHSGATSRPDSRGTGLGLSICQAIVEVHGGSISAQNRTAGGAEFTFRLPLAGTPPEVPVEAAMTATEGGQ